MTDNLDTPNKSNNPNLDDFHKILNDHVKLDQVLDLDNINDLDILQDILYKYVRYNYPNLQFTEYYPIPNKLALDIILPNGDTITYKPNPDNISRFNASNNSEEYWYGSFRRN